MFLSNLAAAIALGVIAPTAAGAPSPSPSPGIPLKTIVTVKSSPYCNALAQHFNNAFVPMMGNDRALDYVNTGLLDINDAFSHPDYLSRLLKARDRIEKYDDQLVHSLPAIQDQINQLREAQKLTSDPKAAAQIHDAAEQLQTAYGKQNQLAIDLHGLVQSMMDDKSIYYEDHPLGGWTPAENAVPDDMKNIKTYLRFDGQRDVISRAEEKAVDIAYDAATTQCAK